jgi:hypothetical protein
MHELDVMMPVLAVVLLLVSLPMLLLPSLAGTLGTLFSVPREEFVAAACTPFPILEAYLVPLVFRRFDGCAELTLLCRLLLEPRVFTMTKDGKEGHLMEGRTDGKMKVFMPLEERLSALETEL